MIFNKQATNIIVPPEPSKNTLSPLEKCKKPKLLTKLFRRKKPVVFVWCFRTVGASTFKSSSWVEFEKKNQFELSKQLNLSNNREILVPASFEIRDKRIFNRKVTITVILKEGIAFAFDPEWSKPITYEISYQPKLIWYRAIFTRFAF